MPGTIAYGEIYTPCPKGAGIAPGASTNPPAETAKLSLPTPDVSLSTAYVSSFSS